MVINLVLMEGKMGVRLASMEQKRGMPVAVIPPINIHVPEAVI